MTNYRQCVDGGVWLRDQRPEDSEPLSNRRSSFAESAYRKIDLPDFFMRKTRVGISDPICVTMRDKNVAQTAPNCIFDQNWQSFVQPLFMGIQRRLPLKIDGDPNGIRTRVTAVKGRCPRPLDDRVSERAAEDGINAAVEQGEIYREARLRIDSNERTPEWGPAGGERYVASTKRTPW